MWANDAAELRKEAARRLEHDWLIRWFCEKYKVPRKSKILLEYSQEELMLEFLEDYIDSDPNQAFPQEEFNAGRHYHRTGDPVVDSWSKDIAEGKTPDFLSSFNSEDRARIEKVLLKGKRKAPPEAPPSPPKIPDVSDLEFHDDYTKE